MPCMSQSCMLQTALNLARHHGVLVRAERNLSNLSLTRKHSRCDSQASHVLRPCSAYRFRLGRSWYDLLEVERAGARGFVLLQQCQRCHRGTRVAEGPGRERERVSGRGARRRERREWRAGGAVESSRRCRELGAQCVPLLPGVIVASGRSPSSGRGTAGHRFRISSVPVCNYR